jgi:hypothetical protein
MMEEFKPITKWLGNQPIVLFAIAMLILACLMVAVSVPHRSSCELVEVLEKSDETIWTYGRVAVKLDDGLIMDAKNHNASSFTVGGKAYLTREYNYFGFTMRTKIYNAPNAK